MPVAFMRVILCNFRNRPDDRGVARRFNGRQPALKIDPAGGFLEF